MSLHFRSVVISSFAFIGWLCGHQRHHHHPRLSFPIQEFNQEESFASSFIRRPFLRSRGLGDRESLQWRGELIVKPSRRSLRLRRDIVKFMAQWHKDKAKHFIIELGEETFAFSLKTSENFFFASSKERSGRGRIINCESSLKWARNSTALKRRMRSFHAPWTSAPDFLPTWTSRLTPVEMWWEDWWMQEK